jgi:predicted SnoaL-like aldol condensation-catalyzing enzyme
VDIWKIMDRRLVEHWDVQQPLNPEQDANELL